MVVGGPQSSGPSITSTDARNALLSDGLPREVLVSIAGAIGAYVVLQWLR